MELYRRGGYEQALGRLSELGARDDLIGNVARFYMGMSHRALGIEAMRQGDFAPAEGHLRAAIQALGREADLSGYLAAVYANTGRSEACATEMERLREPDRPGPGTWRKLAQAQWQAGRRAEAYMTLWAALRRFGENTDLNVQLALFDAAEERFQEARQRLATIVEADCTNAQAHCYLGWTAAAAGDAPAAARSFQRALDLRPADLMLALQLALAARASADSGHAVILRLPEPGPAPATSQMRQLANYVTADSDFLDAFLALPESPVDAELFGMLSGVIQTALADHQDYADLHYHCGRVFLRLGKADRAMHHARRVAEINPRYVQGLLLLARLHADRGELDEAVAHVRRAIRNGADWPDVHCLAGEWMIRCRRPTDARKHLERALELKARYPRAAEALASLAA